MKQSATPIRTASSTRCGPTAGFSRLEATAILATLALLSAVALPGLARTAARSERLICLDNLRQIGNAFNGWSADHGNIRPVRVPLSKGGTYPEPFMSKLGVAWHEFSSVSNYMQSPTILVCPSDVQTRRVALNFGNQPDRGFLHFNYRNNALSYFLHLDAGMIGFGSVGIYRAEFSNDQILAGDRNVQVDVAVTRCSSGIVNAASIHGDSSSRSGWTNTIHQFNGNLLMNDGRVLESSREDFRAPIEIDFNGSIHILLPR